MRRGGPGPRALPEGGDQGSAADGGRRGAGRERLYRGRGALAGHLEAHPTDVAALRMLAEVAARLRRYADAQDAARALPGARAELRRRAPQLCRRPQPAGKAAAALPQVERLLAKEPRNPGYRNLKAAVLANLGDYAESIEVYESVLKEFPHQPKVWMSYGHSLKTAAPAGRQRRCLPPRDRHAADPR